VPSLPAPTTATLVARIGDAPRAFAPLSVAARIVVLRFEVRRGDASDAGREKGETESLPSPLLPFAFCLLPST